MTLPSSLNTPSGWKVTSQTETTAIGPGGGYQPGVRVSFVTGLGVTGSVFIPDAQYSANQVAAAVAEKAALLDQVATLQTPGQ